MNTVPFEYQKASLAFLEGEKMGISTAWIAFGLWLEVVDPTLILGEETCKKNGWICFETYQVLHRHDQAGLLLIRRQRPRQPWAAEARDRQ